METATTMSVQSLCCFHNHLIALHTQKWLSSTLLLQIPPPMAASAQSLPHLFGSFHSSNNHAALSPEFLASSTYISPPFLPPAFPQAKVSFARQHLLLITAQQQSLSNRIFRLGGKKEENGGSETQGTGKQISGFGGRKNSEDEEEAEGRFKFGALRFNLGTNRGDGTIKGGSVVTSKGPIAFPFGRPRRQNSMTVFVAGATGQIGARISQKLLREGFNVRGGVSDLFLAQQLAEFATQYGVINREESRRLNAVEFDFKSVDSIASAIGNAAKVVVTIGPTEDGPRSKVSIDDASRVAEAAKMANVAHVVVVYEPETGNSGNGFLAGLSTFFSSLFSRGGGMIFSDLLDQIIDSDFKYTILKATSTESLDDFAPEIQNLLLLEEGTASEGGKVSKAQISSVVAGALLNTTVSENKIAEVTTSPSALVKSIDELLSAISVDGRRAALAEARAKAEKEEQEKVARETAQAEARAAIEEASKAAQLAAQLEAETKKLAAEEAKVATFAEKAKARAEAAAASVDSLASKVKELGTTNLFTRTIAGQSLGFSLGALAPKAEGVTKLKPAVPFSTKRSPPTKSGPVATAVVAPVAAVSTSKPEIKEIFGGIFKQETVYIDED